MKITRSFVRLTWVMLLLLTSVCAIAQKTVRGTVLDKGTSEPVIGAAVVVDGTTNGTVTDFDGNFSLKVDALPANITVSFLGYVPQSLNAKGTELGKVFIAADNKALEEVVVKSAIAVDRKTPVALTSISPELLEEKIGSKDLPEVLRSTPSVYVSNAGGGYGDTEILMRGFKSANIAVMVNGVPVNDMEWGGVYQSNWQGLGDVIRTIQTQRGLGASKISAPSVGGTVSYITKGLDTKKGGSVSYAVGSDGYNKMMITVSSGMNKKGWAFNLSLAKTWGDGYYQGTEFEGYNWFFNVAKRLNDNHQLSFTALGAPQWHNQRNSANGLTIHSGRRLRTICAATASISSTPSMVSTRTASVGLPTATSTTSPSSLSTTSGKSLTARVSPPLSICPSAAVMAIPVRATASTAQATPTAHGTELPTALLTTLSVMRTVLSAMT